MTTHTGAADGPPRPRPHPPELDPPDPEPTVAVAGATGTVGRHVVRLLAERGVRVAPIARSRGVDLLSGVGLQAALTGASAGVDVANVVTMRQAESVQFFTRATENLLRACRETGVERYERPVQLTRLETSPRRQDLAGPECLLLTEMVRRLCRWRGERRLIVPVRIPGATGRAMADGALLPRGPFSMDGQSFGEWLEGQPGRSRGPVPIPAP